MSLRLGGPPRTMYVRAYVFSVFSKTFCDTAIINRTSELQTGFKLYLMTDRCTNDE